MTKQQRKALRETLEQLREQHASTRPFVQKAVAQERDALTRRHGRHATPAMLRDAEKTIREAAAATMRKTIEAAAPNIAELERHLEALQSDPDTVLRYRMRQRLPAAPAPRTIGDLYMSTNELARIVLDVAQQQAAQFERLRFEQSLPRLRPAELRALAQVAAADNDEQTLLAVHDELRSRPSVTENPTAEINVAKVTVSTLMTARGDSAELADEIADLTAIVGAHREAAQSMLAVRTGNELATVAEATREIAAATATHGPDGAAIVAAERAARRHGDTVPARPIPTPRPPFAIPITDKQTPATDTKPAA